MIIVCGFPEKPAYGDGIVHLKLHGKVHDYRIPPGIEVDFDDITIGGKEPPPDAEWWFEPADEVSH